MNYVNEVDYAKTLTMANTKFIGRVISYQLDLNPDVIELYKKIMKFSDMAIPEEAIESFQYTFTPPRSLNNMNLSDMIGNIDGVINAIIKSFTGEYNNQDDEEINILKDEMYKKLMRQYIPAIDWDMVDTVYEDAKIAAQKIKQEKITKDQIKNNLDSGDEDDTSSF